MDVGVIGGAGIVGASCVFNIARQDIVDEVVIIDPDEDRARGEALDIEHSVLLESSTRITVGGYESIRDAGAVVITASAPIPEGLRDRSQMLKNNRSLVEGIYQQLDEVDVNCPIITATSPTDVLNMVAFRSFEWSHERLLGFNLNDTLRFRWAIAEAMDVDPSTVTAYTIGEHGETQVPVFSNVQIDGQSTTFSDEKRECIADRTLEVTWESFELKGETPRWATGNGIALVVRAIQTDDCRCLPCSVHPGGAYGYSDVSIGLPTRIGSDGVAEIVDLDLAERELDQLASSVSKVKDDYASM